MSTLSPSQEVFFLPDSGLFQSMHITEFCEIKNNLGRDFPGDLVVKNPPCNARDTGSILGQGSKIIHSLGQRSPQTAQLSLHGITTESVHHKDPHAAAKTAAAK